MKNRLANKLVIIIILFVFTGYVVSSYVFYEYWKNKKEAESAFSVEVAEVEEMDLFQKAAKDAMKAPMDALSQMMYDTGMTYDSNSADFIWAAIYYMVNMYPNDIVYSATGKMEINTEDMTVTVHKDILLCYGRAMFADLEQLPPIPELALFDNGTAIIRKQASNDDFYILSITKRGNSAGEIRTWCENEDGTAKAQTLLVDNVDNCVLAYYLYLLVPAEENDPFPYSIKAQSYAANTYEEEPVLPTVDNIGNLEEYPLLDILSGLNGGNIDETVIEESEECNDEP